MAQANQVPQTPDASVARFSKTEVWVQLTTGGKSYPPSLQEMFLDPIFLGMEIWPIDQPASFSALVPSTGGGGQRGGGGGGRGGGRGGGAGATPQAPPVTPPGGAPGPGAGATGGNTERIEPADYPWEPSGGRPHPGYDVLVLNDQWDWPDDTRTLARQAVEAGRGVVLLHHSLGDNQDWSWWYQEVTGGLLVLADRAGMRASVVAPNQTLALRPVGSHPVLQHVGPFTVEGEEAFKGMWQSPNITPLLETTHDRSDRTVAWIGVHPEARIVCIQPGTSRETHHHPAYRMLVRNAILWAARRLI